MLEAKSLKPISPLFDAKDSFDAYSLIVEINSPIHIGVKHGWEAFYGPLVITKSKDNVIYEINNEPAFEVYGKNLKRVRQSSYRR